MGTIKSSREIDAIFRGARRATHPLLIVLVAQTPEGRGLSGRVAFIAGKKLGGAVVRNRCRRVLREVVREAGGPWSGSDVVLISRPGTAGATQQQLKAALLSTLVKAGVLS
jgi:ribonuclease P protein component